MDKRAWAGYSTFWRGHSHYVSSLYCSCTFPHTSYCSLSMMHLYHWATIGGFLLPVYPFPPSTRSTSHKANSLLVILTFYPYNSFPPFSHLSHGNHGLKNQSLFVSFIDSFHHPYSQHQHLLITFVTIHTKNCNWFHNCHSSKALLRQQKKAQYTMVYSSSLFHPITTWVIHSLTMRKENWLTLFLLKPP